MNHPVQACFRSSTAVAARQTFLAPLLTALAAIAAVSDSASAQTAFTLPAPPFELPMVPSVSGNWTVMVGVGGEYKPDFVGANRSMLSPVPIFSIRRAGSAESFRGPRDSASIAFIDFGDLRAGPAAKFVASRKANNYPELNGLGDVNATVELGGFVEYFPVDWFRTRIETRQGLGGHKGVVAVGDRFTSRHAMTSGQLVQPFDISIKSSRSYYLVVSEAKADNLAVLAFTSWLRSEMLKNNADAFAI